MPWPPTFQTDIPVPLEVQLSPPMMSGLEAQSQPGTENDTLGVANDAAMGVLAPGVLGPSDTGIDLVPEAKAPKKDLDPKRQQVIDFALSQIGKPYVWGGTGPNGYDCSGILWVAFKRAGIDMPRVSYAQAARGKVVPLDKLRPGDLVAWENNPDQNGADHIALYLGNGWILEAAHRGTNVRKRRLRANEGAWGVALDY